MRPHKVEKCRDQNDAEVRSESKTAPSTLQMLNGCACLSHVPFRYSNHPYRYSHADFMTEMRETLRNADFMTEMRETSRNISSNLEIFVPAVINLSAGRFNLWDEQLCCERSVLQE